MNGLTRSAAYVAAAVLAGLLATQLIWPEIWAIPRGGSPHWLRDPLQGAVTACVLAIFARLLYLAALGDRWSVRLLAGVCIAVGFAFFFLSIVLLVGNGAGAA